MATLLGLIANAALASGIVFAILWAVVLWWTCSKEVWIVTYLILFGIFFSSLCCEMAKQQKSGRAPKPPSISVQYEKAVEMNEKGNTI